VEFYNPVHDITFPLVLAANDNNRANEIYEVPLVYQTLDSNENYAIQRAPANLGHCRLQYQLD